MGHGTPVCFMFHGLVDMVVMGQRLDWMILVVFCNPNDSMIMFYDSMWTEGWRALWEGVPVLVPVSPVPSLPRLQSRSLTLLGKTMMTLRPIS